MVTSLPLQKGIVTFIDENDFSRINRLHWYFDGKYIVSCKRYGLRKNNKKKKTYLHRFILNAPNGKIVDHIDRNPLNNRKSNLRICTQVENCLNCGMRSNNTSGFKGVYWHKLGKKWMAYITYKGNRIHCGLHQNLIDAYEARKAKEQELGVVI